MTVDQPEATDPRLVDRLAHHLCRYDVSRHRWPHLYIYDDAMTTQHDKAKRCQFGGCQVLTLAVVSVVISLGVHWAGADASCFVWFCPVLFPILATGYFVLLVSRGLAPTGWHGFVVLNAYSRFFISTAGIYMSMAGMLIAIGLSVSTVESLMVGSVAMAVIAIFAVVFCTL